MYYLVKKRNTWKVHVVISQSHARFKKVDMVLVEESAQIQLLNVTISLAILKSKPKKKYKIVPLKKCFKGLQYKMRE